MLMNQWKSTGSLIGFIFNASRGVTRTRTKYSTHNGRQEVSQGDLKFFIGCIDQRTSDY